jgi:GT2 family glycosyltransferase
MSLPRLGVVIVTFNSADVICDCLESLLAATGVHLTITVVDNASTDNTLQVLKDWASGIPWAPSADLPLQLYPAPKPVSLDGSIGASGHGIALIETGINAGFAAGVNVGLASLAVDLGIDRFWVLNPDSVAASGTAAAFATAQAPDGDFALMGGRVLYLDRPDLIQIDGGTLNHRTGVTGNLGLGAHHATTPPPELNSLAFITGASMVASRRFYEMAGPMSEDYFLYYEEVDWALQRGTLPVIYCSGAVVYHRAGTAIGSPTIGRPASPFSLYFKHRGRLRFIRRHFPMSVPLALGYSLAKAGQLLLKGYPTEAWTILSASLDMQPSAAIRNRLSPEAARLAFRHQD